MQIGDFTVSEFYQTGPFDYFKVVQVANLGDLLAKGQSVDVLPPNVGLSRRPLRAIELVAQDKDNFVFHGVLQDDPSSLVPLRAENGLLSGNIRLENETFTLIALSEGQGVLFKRKSLGQHITSPDFLDWEVCPFRYLLFLPLPACQEQQIT